MCAILTKGLRSVPSTLLNYFQSAVTSVPKRFDTFDFHGHMDVATHKHTHAYIQFKGK